MAQRLLDVRGAIGMQMITMMRTGVGANMANHQRANAKSNAHVGHEFELDALCYCRERERSRCLNVSQFRSVWSG